MKLRLPLTITAVLLCMPAAPRAQDRNWIADVSVGWAGFVDDATKHYLLVGGGVRRSITPRISIGPELVVMSNANEVRDRNVSLTGNVVYDAYPASRISPFIVGGAGIFWGRDQVRNGPYWFSDPAFTAGGGVRAHISDAVSAAVDYRIGWELHQRVSGSVAIRW